VGELIQGQGPLTAEQGFRDQGELLVKTRFAAAALSATRMDRPEGFTANPVTGRVYAVMTKNAKREPGDENAPNPRAKNTWGHILELIPPGAGKDADHAADEYGWDILLLAGDPADPAVGARFNPGTSKDGWLVTPENLAFDPRAAPGSVPTGPTTSTSPTVSMPATPRARAGRGLRVLARMLDRDEQGAPVRGEAGAGRLGTRRAWPNSPPVGRPWTRPCRPCRRWSS